MRYRMAVTFYLPTPSASVRCGYFKHTNADISSEGGNIAEHPTLLAFLSREVHHCRTWFVTIIFLYFYLLIAVGFFKSGIYFK